MSADEKTYGKVHDLGYSTRSEYAGQQSLPKGYWVYVAPDWFIWERLNPEPIAPHAPNRMRPELELASVGGKYAQLLRRFEDSGHAEFLEWGGPAWHMEWNQHKDLPKGYWVTSLPIGIFGVKKIRRFRPTLRSLSGQALPENIASCIRH